MDWTLHEVVDFLGRWVLVASMASLILPPVEFFEDFPRFQKWYRLGCKVLKYAGSLDFRGKMIEMYPSYRKQNGAGTAAPNPTSGPAT